MQNEKELKVGEQAHLFALRVYQIMAWFPKEALYGLTSQWRRPATSAAANIAGGCGKRYALYQRGKRCRNINFNQ